MGGGMNVPLTRRIAVRAFEADWLRTQLPNSTTNAQNNLRLGTGLVLRTGRRELAPTSVLSLKLSA
jgi:hypothetical protein